MDGRLDGLTAVAAALGALAGAAAIVFSDITDGYSGVLVLAAGIAVAARALQLHFSLLRACGLAALALLGAMAGAFVALVLVVLVVGVAG